MRALAILLMASVAGPVFAQSLAPRTMATYSTTVRAKVVVGATAGDSTQQWEDSKVLRAGTLLDKGATVKGREKSPCDGPGRESLGDSHASATATEGTGLRLGLHVRAFARGGHVQLCPPCVDGQCGVGARIDTDAGADANVEVSAEVAFPKDAPGNRYFLVVQQELSGNGAQRSIRLLDEKGAERLVRSGEEIPIDGGEGRRYRLVMALSTKAAESGLCCESERQGTLAVNVVLAPAPQLEASVFTTNVRNLTTEAPAVGLLVSRGSRGEPVPACTGTVVGPRTILTAGHCLEFYSAKPELLFVPGSRLRTDVERAIRIVQWARPSDASESGFHYRLDARGRAVDDIALLYTDKPIDIPPMALPKGPMTAPELLGLGTFADLTGFITVTERETRFAGEGAYKVMSRASVVRVAARTVEVVSRSGTLCAGWSGAPVTSVQDLGTVMLAMAVSGDKDCMRAEAVRLDAYAPWLSARIR